MTGATGAMTATPPWCGLALVIQQIAINAKLVNRTFLTAIFVNSAYYTLSVVDRYKVF